MKKKITSIVVSFLEFVERHEKPVTIFGLSCATLCPLISIGGLLRYWGFFVNSQPNVGVPPMIGVGILFIIVASLVATVFIWAIVATLRGVKNVQQC